MIVTIFRSRLNPGMQDEYGPMAKHMSDLVRTIPGSCLHTRALLLKMASA